MKLNNYKKFFVVAAGLLIVLCTIYVALGISVGGREINIIPVIKCKDRDVGGRIYSVCRVCYFLEEENGKKNVSCSYFRKGASRSEIVRKIISDVSFLNNIKIGVEYWGG